jgi:poly(A) polymerase
LRILRYYRFQARYGAQLDPEAEEACAELAPTLKGLSRERVAMELLTLLALPDPSATIVRMHERGVLQVVLPECTHCQIETLERLIASERAAGAAPDPLRRLAALLPPSPPVAETVAARLRLSKRQRGRLTCAAQRIAADADDPRALAYSEGLACATDRLLLEGHGISQLQGWEVPEFPLKGGEIVARGIAAGPDVARILREAEARWVAEGFPDRARVDAILSSLLAARN